MNTIELETIIGLEVHVQLKTETKLFCSCPNGKDAEKPNTFVCPTCIGMVGSLPLINEKAIEYTIRTGIALGCGITAHSKWDRKNYFYPDLPKGFQISQYDAPLCHDGSATFIDRAGKEKNIRINRIHLEEDAAKLVHTSKTSLVDFNRGGVPLMEIVTEPDIRTVEDAEDFLRELRRVVRYLGVSDADLEKGHLRCDASISLRSRGETILYPRTEIKNLNSFKMVGKALSYEYRRQEELWLKGEVPADSATVLWDDNSECTIFMRGKEGAADYRYTAEPDIPEFITTEEMIANIKKDIPLLPASRIKKYMEVGIEKTIAHSVAEDIESADFLDEIITATEYHVELQKLAIKSFLGIYPSLNLKPKEFIKIVGLISEGKISGLIAKDLWDKIKEERVDIENVLQSTLESKPTFDVKAIVLEIIAQNPEVIQEYKGGKKEAINVLIGKAIIATNKQVPVGEIVKALHSSIM